MESRSEERELVKFAETIRHFRGYVDKNRFAEDVEFLRELVRAINTAEQKKQSKAA